MSLTNTKKNKRLQKLAVAIFLLTGCAKKESDHVAEAQACLDSSTSATALSCLSLVDGISSASANTIRCSIYFVDQGFSEPARLSAVADQITSNANPDSASFQALATMGFTASKYSMPQNDTLSATAFSFCQSSKSPGLIYLSSMSRIATATLNDISFDPTSGTPPSATDVQNSICTGPGPSATTKAAMGSAALAAYKENCNAQSTDLMCLQYAAAINGQTDPTVIGDGLTDVLCN